MPLLDRLIGHAVAYYQGLVKPAQVYRRPSEDESRAFEDLAQTLAGLPADATAETIQTEVYEVGKRHPGVGDLKAWFRALYQCLLGQDEGPRMGSFIAVYGLPETIRLIERALAGEDLSQG
jgi:lysyl-tRNA synthetase class 1